MHPTPLRARGSLRALVTAAMLAAALSLLGTAALAQGVVTLETPAPPGAQPSASPGALTPPSDPQEAMLAYVECMRDHGVDMPDPEFTADGGMTMRVGGEGRPDAGLTGGPGDPAFQEAQEACGSLMEGTVRDLDPEQQAEMQAQALAFAECMREHGVDMPDPQFDENGGVGIMIGGPDAPRIDPETMQAAQEACGALMGPVPGAPDGGAAPQPSAALP
ncbi:MAG: hypothetical protein ABWZ82_07440 [Candidatus Limnocylindrales bacterium]